MKLVSMLVLLVCSLSFADVAPKTQVVDVKKIDSLVNAFYMNKYQKEKASLFESFSTGEHHPICNPDDRKNCMDVACDKLGTFGCDTQSEIDAVGLACRGVDGDCVESACAKLGTFGCDTLSEIQSVGAICRNVFDGKCVDAVCEHLGTFGCDTLSEVQQVGAICTGRVDSDCIESVCTRLGAFGCDTISEVQQVAKSCGGKN